MAAQRREGVQPPFVLCRQGKRTPTSTPSTPGYSPSAQHYASYVVAGVHVKGNLTLAEDLADTGGLRLAWSALSRAHRGSVDKQTAQLFFESFAQVAHTFFRHHFYSRRLFDIQFLTLIAGVVLQNRREVAAPQCANRPARSFTSESQRRIVQHA